MQNAITVDTAAEFAVKMGKAERAALQADASDAKLSSHYNVMSIAKRKNITHCINSISKQNI